MGRFNGLNFEPINVTFGGGSQVSTFATVDNDGDGPSPSELYIGGYFYNFPYNPLTSYVARWAGSNWEPLCCGQNY